MNKPNRPSLVALAAEITAKAASPTIAARTEACERCGKRVPAGSLFHDDETEQAVCGNCPRAPLALTLRAVDARDAAKAPTPMALPERAWIDESETLRAEIARLGALLAEVQADLRNAESSRDAFKAEGDRLMRERDAARRELAEARNDRKAEARVQVATDAHAWHFEGPQGEGTADRIKAVGGVWRFHKRADRDRFVAAGFWVVPNSEASTELLNDLSGRRIRVAPL